MAKNFVHEGGPADVMPWTNNSGSAVVSGQVVSIKHQIGIALVNIAAGAVGSVAIGGVVRNVAKATGHAWSQGEKLNWDVSAQAFDYSGATPATGDITGGACAWLAALSGDTLGVIRLTPGNNTLT